MNLTSFEAISQGHPDKFADQISDKIVSFIHRKQNTSNLNNANIQNSIMPKCAVETLAKGDTIVVAGEVSASDMITLSEIRTLIDTVIADVNYDDSNIADNYKIINLLSEQSVEIKNAVDLESESGAGDQGIMFGYAENDSTCNFLPREVFFTQKLMKDYSDFLKNGMLKHFGVDAKCQLSFDQNRELQKVVISVQHKEQTKKDMIQSEISNFVTESLKDCITSKPEFIINPSGSFVVGGIIADCGLTGRKIICDTYSGFGRHGGGAFSGKDATKVDRSGAYMARNLAKHIVQKYHMKKCEVQIGYAIGQVDPVSLAINTSQENDFDSSPLVETILRSGILRPTNIIKNLALNSDPEEQFYRSSQHGHFSNPDFTWEKELTLC